MVAIKCINPQHHTSDVFKIVFQGDSITEAYRNLLCREDMGEGYVRMLTHMLTIEFPKKKFEFFNCGIGGDKVGDLRARWGVDCLNLEPDVVSIFIGVNDVVGRYFWSRPTRTLDFEKDYRDLLEQTRDSLDAEIILLTPFIDFKTNRNLAHKLFLKQKIDIIKKLSREFNTTLISLDIIFSKVIEKSMSNDWTTDGIHPTSKGHRLIAQSWLKGSNEIFATDN
ncbi:MAG: SGNH/GDSL hydrolase family protein [Nitrososphaerota archaeon]|nr:SGNH/GDSL hydrolase family protein [Nitrososphaerota archaeon]